MDTYPHLMRLASAQGKAPRVLFVCRGGILRSATAMHHFATKYGWNTRCAGTEDYALIPVSEALLTWADAVFVMEDLNVERLKANHPDHLDKVICLHIPDVYDYMELALIRALENAVDAHEVHDA